MDFMCLLRRKKNIRKTYRICQRISSFIFISFVWLDLTRVWHHRFSMSVFVCVCPSIFVHFSVSIWLEFISLHHNGILAHGTEQSVYTLWVTASDWEKIYIYIPFVVCLVNAFACTHTIHILQIECHSKVLNYARTFWMLFVVFCYLEKYRFEYVTYLFLFLSVSPVICWNKKCKQTNC